MPGDSKAMARTAAVIVLLLLAIVALRGYLPGAEPAPDTPDPEPDGPGSVVATFVMLGLSMAIIAIAAITQLRRRPRVRNPGELPYDQARGRIRVPWRMLLIASVVLVAWLLVVLQLMRWGSGFVDSAVDSAPTVGPESEAGDAETSRVGEDLVDTFLPEPSGDSGDVFGYLAAATVVLLVLAIISAVIGRRLAEATVPVPAGRTASSTGPTAGPDLAKAAELGLAEIGDHTRDPREAIIACWLAMERELAKSPGTSPQDSDTPSEVLARAVERRAVRANSAAELVALFQEARFSSHVMNEGHRAAAVRALRVVQRELQGAT